MAPAQARTQPGVAVLGIAGSRGGKGGRRLGRHAGTARRWCGTLPSGAARRGSEGRAGNSAANVGSGEAGASRVLSCVRAQQGGMASGPGGGGSGGACSSCVLHCVAPKAEPVTGKLGRMRRQEGADLGCLLGVQLVEAVVAGAGP